METFGDINPLKAELNPIRHLLALLGARHILRVKQSKYISALIKTARISQTASYRNLLK
jgi:hypothetical protein